MSSFRDAQELYEHFEQFAPELIVGHRSPAESKKQFELRHSTGTPIMTNSPAQNAATEILVGLAMGGNEAYHALTTRIIQQAIDETTKGLKTEKQIQAGFIGMRFIWHGSQLDTLQAIRTHISAQQQVIDKLVEALEKRIFTKEEIHNRPVCECDACSALDAAKELNTPSLTQ